MLQIGNLRQAISFDIFPQEKLIQISREEFAGKKWSFPDRSECNPYITNLKY